MSSGEKGLGLNQAQFQQFARRDIILSSVWKRLSARLPWMTQEVVIAPWGRAIFA
jgi:hypothetical protein